MDGVGALSKLTIDGPTVARPSPATPGSGPEFNATGYKPRFTKLSQKAVVKQAKGPDGTRGFANKKNHDHKESTHSEFRPESDEKIILGKVVVAAAAEFDESIYDQIPKPAVPMQLKALGRFLDIPPHMASNFDRIRAPASKFGWFAVEADASKNTVLMKEVAPGEGKVYLHYDGGIAKFKEEFATVDCIKTVEDCVAILAPTSLTCPMSQQKRHFVFKFGMPVLRGSDPINDIFFDYSSGTWRPVHA